MLNNRAPHFEDFKTNQRYSHLLNVHIRVVFVPSLGMMNEKKGGTVGYWTSCPESEFVTLAL